MCQTQVGHTTKFWQKSEYVKCLSARFILKVYLDVAWLFLLILNVDMHMQNWCYRGEAECRVQSENVAPRIPLFLSTGDCPPFKSFLMKQNQNQCENHQCVLVYWITCAVPAAPGCVLFCGSIYTHTRGELCLTQLLSQRSRISWISVDGTNLWPN